MMDGSSKGRGDASKQEKSTAKQEKKKKDKGNPQTADKTGG